MEEHHVIKQGARISALEAPYATCQLGEKHSTGENLLREIDIEEVEVQASLDDTSRHCDRINDTLRKVPITSLTYALHVNIRVELTCISN